MYTDEMKKKAARRNLPLTSEDLTSKELTPEDEELLKGLQRVQIPPQCTYIPLETGLEAAKLVMARYKKTLKDLESR